MVILDASTGVAVLRSKVTNHADPCCTDIFVAFLTIVVPKASPEFWKLFTRVQLCPSIYDCIPRVRSPEEFVILPVSDQEESTESI